MLEKLTLKEQNAILQLAKTVGTVIMVIVYGSRLHKLKTNDIDVIFVCESITCLAKINTVNNEILATSGINIHPFIIPLHTLMYKLSLGDPQTLTFLKYGFILKNLLFTKTFLSDYISKLTTKSEIYELLLQKLDDCLLNIKKCFNYRDANFILISICQLICRDNGFIPRFPNGGLFEQAASLCPKLSFLILETASDYKINKRSSENTIKLMEKLIQNYKNLKEL